MRVISIVAIALAVAGGVAWFDTVRPRPSKETPPKSVSRGELIKVMPDVAAEESVVPVERANVSTIFNHPGAPGTTYTGGFCGGSGIGIPPLTIPSASGPLEVR